MELNRILIVDDSPEDREYARFLLKRVRGRQWECAEAETGEAGLEMVAAGMKFECILLDYNLPDLTGVEFLKKLKEGLGDTGIASVLLTGGNEGVAVSALKAGADDYVSKNGLTAEVLSHAIANAMDLSKLRRDTARTLEELRRSNEDLQHFADAASHDLKSPLRTVSLLTQILMKRCEGVDEESARLSKVIHDHVKRASGLIEDLLAHARAGSSEQSPPQNLPLDTAVESVLGALDHKIRETGALVGFQSLPQVFASRVHLEQVLQNLLENSLKYRRPSDSPCIEISAQPRNGEWVIAVRDNGQGFQAEFADVIFQPFKRLHGLEYPGSGIGLATCRKLVERNGGKIWAESEFGQGSTFYFTVPAAAANAGRE